MKSRIIKFIFIWIAIAAALGAIVMLLWNLLIPGIFGLAAISFWQALGLFVLARILFGGFRPRRPGMMHHHHPMHHKMGENPIHEKWQKMTPEQRRTFIEKRRKFGFGGAPFGRECFNMDEQDGPCEDK